MKPTTVKYCSATREDFQPFDKVMYVVDDNNCVTLEASESINAKMEERMYIPSYLLKQHIQDCVRQYRKIYGEVDAVELLNDLSNDE